MVFFISGCCLLLFERFHFLFHEFHSLTRRDRSITTGPKSLLNLISRDFFQRHLHYFPVVFFPFLIKLHLILILYFCKGQVFRVDYFPLRRVLRIQHVLFFHSCVYLIHFQLVFDAGEVLVHSRAVYDWRFFVALVVHETGGSCEVLFHESRKLSACELAVGGHGRGTLTRVAHIFRRVQLHIF